MEYINYFISKTKDLNKDEIYSKEGHLIAANLLRVLALQGLFGSGGYDWITEEDEPALYKMQYYANILDEAPDKPEVWDSLIRLTDEL